MVREFEGHRTYQKGKHMTCHKSVDPGIPYRL